MELFCLFVCLFVTIPLKHQDGWQFWDRRPILYSVQIFYFCIVIPAWFKSSLLLSGLNVKVKWGSERFFFTQSEWKGSNTWEQSCDSAHWYFSSLEPFLASLGCAAQYKLCQLHLLKSHDELCNVQDALSQMHQRKTVTLQWEFD